MKRGLFLLALFFISATVSAQGQTSPKAMVETFLGTVQKGNANAAYDQLFVGSSIPTDKPQALAALKQQTQAGLPLYGKILGHEIVLEEQLSESVVRYLYFLKTEKLPITWEFYFYKPKSQWVLVNIIFNDQFNLLGTKK
jgi:hypothetical protein